jgi:hypothetical protein
MRDNITLCPVTIKTPKTTFFVPKNNHTDYYFYVTKRTEV